ncbi:MAG: hypothetical protein RIQ88_976 [Actinomycetota bacterium]
MASQPKGEPWPENGLIPIGFDSSQNSFHAYVHVPYCLTRCGYCDFNTYTATELGNSSRSDYFKEVIKEIDLSVALMAQSGIKLRKLSSIFFGGGTPTLLPASDLTAIANHLEKTFGFEAGIEITTEANPDSVDKDYLLELSANGFTRVSFGMQSAVPTVLRTLERTHNPDNVAKNVLAAKEAGLEVSVDLIYGTPGESLSDWEISLREAINLNTDHISAYSLIVEPGTKMHRQVSSGELSQPDDNLHAEMYLLAEQLLSEAGFVNYEVSNWARFGKVSKHNIAYWLSKDWWGYGPGAHSHIAGTRWWNIKHPAAYSQQLSLSKLPIFEREVLSVHDQDVERVMLEIRLESGLDLDWLKAKGFAEAKVIAELVADGLVEGKRVFEGRLVLTLQGRLLADLITRRLLGF